MFLETPVYWLDPNSIKEETLLKDSVPLAKKQNKIMKTLVILIVIYFIVFVFVLPC